MDRHESTRRTFADAFHAHLDGCRQCANNPFALCTTGAMLLKASVVLPTKKAPTP